MTPPSCGACRISRSLSRKTVRDAGRAQGSYPLPQVDAVLGPAPCPSGPRAQARSHCRRNLPTPRRSCSVIDATPHRTHGREREAEDSVTSTYRTPAPRGGDRPARRARSSAAGRSLDEPEASTARTRAERTDAPEARVPRKVFRQRPLRRPPARSAGGASLSTTSMTYPHKRLAATRHLFVIDISNMP